MAEKPRMGPRGQGDTRPLRGEPTVITVASKSTVTFPPPSKSWLKSTRGDWQVLTHSPVASAYLESDIPALVRLFDLRNEYAKINATAKATPFDAGSVGQLRSHPAVAHANQLLTQVLAAERTFGLNPAARAKLGLHFAQAAVTTADLRLKVKRAEVDPR